MEWNDEKNLEFQAISRLNDASVHRLHAHVEVRVTKEWDMWATSVVRMWVVEAYFKFQLVLFNSFWPVLSILAYTNLENH